MMDTQRKPFIDVFFFKRTSPHVSLEFCTKLAPKPIWFETNSFFLGIYASINSLFRSEKYMTQVVQSGHVVPSLESKP